MYVRALAAVRVLCAALVLLAGCGRDPSGAVAPATALPSGPAPPLTVELRVEGRSLKPGDTFGVTLRATPQERVRRLTGRLTATGVVGVVSAPSLVWVDPPPSQPLVAQARLRLTGLGEGAVRFEAQVPAEAGAGGYGQATTLYILVTDTGVLSGTSSPLSLQLEHLDLLRAAGRLTEEEYRRERERLLGGGATETITTVVPSR